MTTTMIRYQVPGLTDVRLTVYDLLGKEVMVLVNERKTPGGYEITFDGGGLGSACIFSASKQARSSIPRSFCWSGDI